MRSARRSFLKKAAAATFGAPLFVPHLFSQPPNGRVRHASFGADGMAGADIGSLTSHPSVDLICVAEVDTRRQEGVRKRFGDKLRVYQDWRQMLDKEAKNLDSVNVSTPDHMHAPMAMAAMQLGLHAYVQKPLAHDVYECRRLAEVARERKLITQMGIQVHSATEYRLAVALVQTGAVGQIREVHTWSSKKWGDPNARPDRKDQVPANLDWDLWLGVAEDRPFINGYYHPGEWRRRLDFGTGTFGDMGCHIYDPMYEAVGLTTPLSVRSEGPAPNRHNWANDASNHYVFPGTKFTEGKTVNVTWYDGDQRPPRAIQQLLGSVKPPDQGSILIGSRGVLLIPHVARPQLFPAKDFRDFAMPKVQAANHYHQFINAILGKGSTTASFDYSGPLTESVLLGGVATHFPKTTLEWDTAKLSFRKHADADRLIRRTYRKGWEVTGLSARG
jgi:predicted dehydrogenase